jgi:cytochrome b involved in lipid metabolism
VSITSPVQNSSFPSNQTVTISVSATDASGIAYVELSIDNIVTGKDTVSPFVFTSTFTTGGHSVSARAVDPSGNSKTSTITITATAPTTETPVTPTPSPTPTSQNTYTLTEVATHNTQGNCWLVISGNIYNVTSFLSSHPGGVSTITPHCGTDATTAFQTKGYGNNHSNYAYSLLPTYFVASVGSASPSPTPTPTPNPQADTTPPTVTMLTPVNNASFPANQSITISASASDASGVSYVEFSVDGTVVSTDYSSPYSAVTTIAIGSHTVTARAVDASGHYAIAAITVVATVPPTPSPTPTPTPKCVF